MTSVMGVVRRRPISLTIREDLLGAARALGVDASQAAEAGIADAVHRAREAAWLEANREAIAKHTAWLDEHGKPPEPAMYDVKGWFAAMDACADEPFTLDVREQPRTLDLD